MRKSAHDLPLHTVVRWHRPGGRTSKSTLLQWTVASSDWPEPVTYHCNNHATFLGEATGANYFKRQVTGWAWSPYSDSDAAISKALRRHYKAASVRYVEPAEEDPQ